MANLDKQIKSQISPSTADMATDGKNALHEILDIPASMGEVTRLVGVIERLDEAQAELACTIRQALQRFPQDDSDSLIDDDSSGDNLSLVTTGFGLERSAESEASMVAAIETLTKLFPSPERMTGMGETFLKGLESWGVFESPNQISWGPFLHRTKEDVVNQIKRRRPSAAKLREEGYSFEPLEIDDYLRRPIDRSKFNKIYDTPEAVLWHSPLNVGRSSILH